MSQQAQADVEFIQGEFGDIYNFTVKNPDGSLADLSGFVGGTNTLIVTDSNYTSPPLISTAVGLNVGLSEAQWTMTLAQTQNLSGSYIAMLVFITPGNTLIRRTKPMSVYVWTALPAS